MSKILIIARREFLTRVRKRSFILMTLLGPLILSAMFMVPSWLVMVDNEQAQVLIWEEGKFFEKPLTNEGEVQFVNLICSREEAMMQFEQSTALGLLIIPKETRFYDTEGVRYYRRSKNALIENLIQNAVKSQIFNDLYIEATSHHESHASRYQLSLEDHLGAEILDESKIYIGIGSGIFIYFFIFLYGIQVMKGVIEEKSNRIVEVIITTVKPFQMMMGKILGLSLVGLTQFVVWVAATGLLSITVGKAELLSSYSDQFIMALSQANLPLVIGSLLFYFLGGYLLYAALFAIAGSGSDFDTDTQQFILPITIPLLFSVMMVYTIILEPHGTTARIMSLFPLTSPICMMVRVPFADSNPYFIWELIGSMVSLIIGFIFTTWLAGRIYRVGILMYGKKASFRELFKWFFVK